MDANTMNCPKCGASIGARFTLVTSGLKPDLPPSDFVVQTWREEYLRVRLQWVEEGEFVNSPSLGCEWVNAKISVAPCDATGNVTQDPIDQNIIFGAEVHSLKVSMLNPDPATGVVAISLDGFLGQKICAMLQAAEAYTAAHSVLAARFPMPTPAAEPAPPA